MANAFTTAISPYWEAFIDGWESSQTITSRVAKFRPAGVDLARQADTTYRPMDYQVDTVSGLDISGSAATDLIQRMVPATLGVPQNVKFTLTSPQMRDPQHMERAGRAAGVRLAALAESNLASAIATKAANVLTQSAAFSWALSANASRIMTQKGVPASAELVQVLSPLDAQDIRSELGSRGTVTGPVEGAYVRNALPMIAGIPSYEADIMPVTLAKGTVTGITVTAGGGHTVTAMTGNVPTDNRQFTIGVSGANYANTKNGDAFTIAGVYSVHEVTKDVTSDLQTFRIISGATTASWVIYPAPVATGPYQNVSAAPGTGAAITFVNSTSVASSVMFDKNSVELMIGEYMFPADMGPKVMKTTTTNGIPLTMSYDFNHLTGVVTGRVHGVWTPIVLNPEKCALMLARQA